MGRRLFFAILVLAAALRIGYGVARHGEALTRTGADFISLWDHDALEHVLLAQSLLNDGAYRVPPQGPPLALKNIRSGNHDALYKAPLYQYFLAAVFAISGFNFALFFPLQALIGGLACGLLALITLELFGSWRAGAVAGVLASIHPVLLNSASLPYNESLFVALLLGSVWAFLRWFRAPDIQSAIITGALAGLAVLCRESGAPLLVAMAAFAIVVRPSGLRPAVGGAVTMLVVATLVVVPWTMRNFMRTGQFIPVATVTGMALAEGNNPCVAREPFFSWYWAEGMCAPLQLAFDQRLVQYPREQWDNTMLHNEIRMAQGKEFIATQPGPYLALSARRAATLFLPFHPRQPFGRMRQAIMVIYWLAVVPLGLAGIILSLRRMRSQPLLMLPVLLIAAVVVPQILVYFSPDMRYRLPADLLLACFAGHVIAETVGHRIDRRFSLRLRSRRSAPAVA